jgi:hypothetical protein
MRPQPDSRRPPSTVIQFNIISTWLHLLSAIQAGEVRRTANSLTRLIESADDNPAEFQNVLNDITAIEHAYAHPQTVEPRDDNVSPN